MAFARVEQRSIPDIEATMEEYVHADTGMRHFHVRRADPEKGFVLAIPTIPTNEKGIPHILEHLSLSGSERFPVRNAFFSMQRNSVASFMNAMTGQDFTLFPFATPSEQDYWNLMDVYSDAVFFPNLDRLDFLQEGWRPTYDDEDNLRVDGVVYNEMQGAMNGRGRRWRQALLKEWHDGSLHGLNAGGEPIDIPKLGYEELRQFHQDHYHPSRAVLLTYGDIDVEAVQKRFEDHVLSRGWERKGPLPAIVDAAPIGKRVTLTMPCEGEPEKDHGVCLAWAASGETPLERLRNEAMERLLMDGAGPIRTALQEANLGRLGGIGYMADSHPPMFLIEMQGLAKEEIATAEQLILDVVRGAAGATIDPEMIDAVLRDFEISQREITSNGGMPFGIAKLCEAGTLALHGKSPAEAFAAGPAFALLRAELSPESVQAWVGANLTDQPALMMATLPDPEYQIKEAAALAAQLASIAAGVTPETKAQIKKDQAELKERQERAQDINCLPRLRVSDLSPLPIPIKHAHFTPGDDTTVAQTAVSVSANGMTYVTAKLDISQAPPELLPWIDMTIALAPGLGLGDMGWQEATQWRQRSFYSHDAAVVDGRPIGQDRISVSANFAAAGRTGDVPQMATALRKSLEEIRVDEEERVRQLITDHTNSMRQSLSSGGHSMALTQALSAFSPRRALQHQLSGRASLQFCYGIADAMQTPEGTAHTMAQLELAREWLSHCPIHVIAGGDDAESAAEIMATEFAGRAGYRQPWGGLRQQDTVPALDVALVGNTGVQYAYKVWPAPRQEDVGSGLCALTGRAVTMEFLHGAVRERGGAYGARADYVGDGGALVMSSFRDPRFAATLKDFDAAAEWASEGGIGERLVEEAIVATLRDADRPRTPVDEIELAVAKIQGGLSDGERLRLRTEVLTATPEKIQAQANIVFGGRALTAGFISSDKTIEAELAGMSVEPLDPTIAVPKSGPKIR